jgi:hypothetical protein
MMLEYWRAPTSSLLFAKNPQKVLRKIVSKPQHPYHLKLYFRGPPSESLNVIRLRTLRDLAGVQTTLSLSPRLARQSWLPSMPKVNNQPKTCHDDHSNVSAAVSLAGTMISRLQPHVCQLRLITQRSKFELLWIFAPIERFAQPTPRLLMRPRTANAHAT